MIYVAFLEMFISVTTYLFCVLFLILVHLLLSIGLQNSLCFSTGYLLFEYFWMHLVDVVAVLFLICGDFWLICHITLLKKLVCIDTFPIFYFKWWVVGHPNKRPIQNSAILMQTYMTFDYLCTVRLPFRRVQILEVAAVMELVEALPRHFINFLPSPVFKGGDNFWVVT